MKNIIYVLVVFLLASCYEDKGNYDYREINEVAVSGVDSVYNVDQFDTLRIYPDFTGTQYADENKFSFEWEINRKVEGREKDLVLPVRLPLGETYCRLIVTDNVLQTKAQAVFRIRVANSTAADLIVVLSNYKNRAELSYKRLDKENAGFVNNYYYEVTGGILGTNPQKLYQNYNDLDVSKGLEVLVDEGLKIIDQNTMIEKGVIDENFFRRQMPPTPAPVFTGYKVESAVFQIGDWTSDPWGLAVQNGFMHLISGGRSYYYYQGSSRKVTINDTSAYGGYLSPCSFLTTKEAVIGSGFMSYLGYRLSTYMLMFDETVGRFVAGSRGAKPVERISELDAIPGYRLKFGAPLLSDKNYCVAVLDNEAGQVKALLLKTPKDAAERAGSDNVAPMPFQILGQHDVSKDVMNSKTCFYAMEQVPDLLFATKDKLYKCNIRNWTQTNPSSSQVICSLSDFGYDGDAEITCMYVSRSEQTVMLGVSRYGADISGSSDELKGDLLVLDAATYRQKEIYRGVSGYPMDIRIKYQYYFRHGENESGNMMDNI